MSTNDPAVIGIFGLCLIACLTLSMVVTSVMARDSKLRTKRADDQIFKAVEEARRDFS
jgi:hypothetical protein